MFVNIISSLYLLLLRLFLHCLNDLYLVILLLLMILGFMHCLIVLYKMETAKLSDENYMESDKYPEASFKGKIIEEEDLAKDGEYEVRAKGVFIIHGISQERIIKANVSVKNNQVTIVAKFSVMLSDHNIPIPIVVYKKLANEIKVEVNAVLEPR